MKALEFAQILGQTIEERGAQYGPVLDNIERIASFVWLLTGKPCDPLDVVKVLVAVKLSRLAQDDGHLDSTIDLAGYAALWAEVASSRGALSEPAAGV